MKESLKFALRRAFCRRAILQDVKWVCATPIVPVVMFGAVVGLCVLVHVGSLPSSESEAKQNWSIERLLVLPFKVGVKKHEMGTDVQSPLSGAVFQAGPVEPGADVHMTKELVGWVRKETPCTLIPYGAAVGVRSRILSEKVHISEHDLLVEIGKRLKADAVLSGIIYRFRQRVGRGYSVDTPASVAFGIHLIRIADGRLLWVGHFDEAQHSLSENLFNLPTFVKRGGGWLTAEELGRFGLHETMATFPLH